MDEAALVRLIDDVCAGAVHPDDAVAALRRLPFVDLGFARVDHHRSLRQGLPDGRAPAASHLVLAECR